MRLNTLLALMLAGCSSSPSAPAPPESFVTTTYQQGSTLYLQNATASDTLRIGLDTAWGGSIIELSDNGVNVVNAHDPGREVQIGLYDGNAAYDSCGGCAGMFGWDPVQAGDRYEHGAPTLSLTRGTASLYTKVQPFQWYPDDKGGGPTHPVGADVLIEQTVSPIAGHANAFRVHFIITHVGTDSHANAHQEIPAVYANADYSRFVTYGGSAPFTGGATSVSQFPRVGGGGGLVFDSELWGAYVNEQNVGLTVYVPSSLPYAVGFYNPGPGGATGDGTNYFSEFMSLTIGPGFTTQGDYYVIDGDYRAARSIIYELHANGADPDIGSPFGAVNAPASGATVSGNATVIGWAMDNVSVASVQITVDGASDGTATYGTSRPDVQTVFPNASANLGFTYVLNTAHYANGPHILTARVTDASGNVAIFPNVGVTITN